MPEAGRLPYRPGIRPNRAERLYPSAQMQSLRGPEPRLTRRLLQEKEHPLVLLTHGGVRSAPDTGAWLGVLLAQEGFVVAEINAPRASTAAVAVDEIWRRPQDVSRALDTILGDEAWSGQLDESRVAAVGYALGGTAAIALMGGRFDADAFVRACDKGNTGPDCAWYAAQGIALGAVDRDALEQAARDPRITAAVAIDAEYPEAFARGGLPDSYLSIALAPEAPADVVIAGATPFDGFPLCTPKGAAILEHEGEDPMLCKGAPEERARIHREVAWQISRYLDR